MSDELYFADQSLEHINKLPMGSSNLDDIYRVLPYETNYSQHAFTRESLINPSFTKAISSAKLYLKTGVLPVEFINVLVEVYSQRGFYSRGELKKSEIHERIAKDFTGNKEILKDSITKAINILASWNKPAQLKQLNIAAHLLEVTKHSKYSGADFTSMYPKVLTTIRKNKLKIDADTVMKFEKSTELFNEETITGGRDFHTVNIRTCQNVLVLIMGKERYQIASYQTESGYGYY